MSLVMPVITFPYASRILMPEGIGKVNFSHSIVSYFSMIAGLGISSYAIREGAKIRDDKSQFSKFAKEMWLINITSTVVAYVLLIVALLVVSNLKPYFTLILICSVTIMLSTMGLPWIYAAKEEFKYITLRTCFFQVISLIYLFVFVRTSGDIVQYTIFGIISSVGSNICNFFYSQKFIDWRGHYDIEIKKHLKPIFTLFGMTVAQSIYLVLDTSILGVISGDEAVGYYHAATKLNKMVMGVITAINSIMVPRLSYYLEKDRTKYNELLEKNINFLLIMCVPITVGFYLLSKDIMIVFCGQRYLSAITPMNILTPIITLISFSSFICHQVFVPNRQDKYCLYSVIVGAIINLTLNLILIPKFSYNGAAIATLVAEMSVTTICFIYCCKTVEGYLKYFKYIYQYLLSACVMGFVLFCLGCMIKNTFLRMVLSVVAGMLVYGVILIIMKNNFMIDTLKKLTKKQ